MDLVLGGALGADRGDVLSGLADWVRATFAHEPRDPELFERAMTHSSRGADSYERLEFLGDRVLGISMAEWLFELFPDEPEGKLTRRFNELVSGATCAEVARGIGAAAHLRLNKQAYNDGAADSDYVLGDVVESLLGAVYLEGGLDPARAFVRRVWADRIRRDGRPPQHPKSQLQEWAASNNRKIPEYAVTDQTGPDHAPRFTVTVRVGKLEESAAGASRQEAETEAAKGLLARVLADQPARRKKGRGDGVRASA